MGEVTVYESVLWKSKVSMGKQHSNMHSYAQLHMFVGSQGKEKCISRAYLQFSKNIK